MAETNSSVIPDFDREVPTGTAVPIQEPPSRMRLESGVVQVTIEEMTAGLSSKQSLFQVETTFRVTLPKEYQGTLIWENFVIGDQQDSQALQLETWGRTVGGSRFRHLADVMQVPFGKLSTMVSQMLKKDVVVDMYTFYEPAKTKDGSDNPYAGKVRRRIRDFFRVGTKALAAKGKEFTGDAEGAAPTVAANPNEPMTCPVPGCGMVVAASEFPAHAAAH